MLEENRVEIVERIRGGRGRPGDRLGRRRRSLLLLRFRREFADGDFICALLAEAMLAKEPGSTVLYDPRSSRAVPDTVAALGGRTDLSRVGHAFFKARMREEDAIFGGEVSGHYYFRDFYCADSGSIPALLMLELLSTEGQVADRADGGLSLALLHLRRDQLRGGRPGGEDGRDRASATPTARSPTSTGSRSTTPTGTSTCAPPTPSRCCASTSSRWSHREHMEEKRDEVLG